MTPPKMLNGQPERDVDADDQQQRAPGGELIRRQAEGVLDVEGQEHEDAVGDHADHAEDDEQRAGDVVEAAGVALGAILRDELDDRAAEPEVEDREIRRHRRGQHPQAVGRRAEVGHVERQQHQADQRVEDDRHVARRHVARHRRELAIVVAPHRVRRVRSARHLAPFPKRITLTVSSTMVRSKTIDRCLM